MDNKNKILEIAIELFATKGYDTVGVQEIADRSGITKPTLYHYFGSKSGLFDAILEKFYGELIDFLKPVFSYNHDLTKNLTDFAYKLFEFVKSKPDFYRMILSESFSLPDNPANVSVRKYNEIIHLSMNELFTKTCCDHGNMKGSEKELSATFIGIMNTYSGLYLNGYVKFGDEMIFKIIRHFMYGIFS